MNCGPTHHFGCACHEKQWQEKLEKAERERDDARETLSDVRRAIGARKNEGIRLAAMRVKAERDEALEQAAQLREKYRVHHDEAERITAEIFDVRKQRDRLAEALRNLKAEYDDQKNQFGDSPLWTKHEDIDVIKDCHAMIAAVEAVQMSNRPTPETDEPVSLREAADRPNGSISRIHQYDADACCRRFDELERQLAEARSAYEEETKSTMDMDRKIVSLESERNEARLLFEYSKAVRKSLADACDHLQRELDNAKRERDNAITDAKQFEVDCLRALHERNEAREQRDKLAEALQMWRAEGPGSNACFCDAQFAMHGAHPSHSDECKAAINALSYLKTSQMEVKSE